MSRGYGVPSPGAVALGGAVGGAIAGAAALASLTVVAAHSWQRAVAAPNAVGATFVRWLQWAAPDALGHPYWDATLGGALLIVAAGALVGGVFALLMSHLSGDHPLVVAILLSAAAWFAWSRAVAPAIDPLAVRAFSAREWLVPFVVYGTVLGAWVAVCRSVALWSRSAADDA